MEVDRLDSSRGGRWEVGGGGIRLQCQVEVYFVCGEVDILEIVILFYL